MSRRPLFLFLSALNMAALAALTPAAAQELGINRQGLSSQSSAVQEKTLQDIHSLHAKWFRDGLNFNTPEDIAKTVNEIRLVKQNDLKILAGVSPSYKDYPGGYKNPNAGEDFQKRCGWPQGSGELSKVDLNKFAQRLRPMLSALKAANLTVDAFEIGNEYDWICFNGDVPNGHAVSDAELTGMVHAYGEILKTAAILIHDPQYFPQAKIITFGIAHSSDEWDKPPHHISHPAAQFVAKLRNVNGFNYLDNSLYHVDGYGTHIYPWEGNVAGSVRNTLREDAAALSDKPLWVTEWGFLSHKQFPNSKGQTLNQGLAEILSTCKSFAKERPLGPVMFYAYNGWLVDNAGNLQPEAQVLSAYAAQHESQQ